MAVRAAVGGEQHVFLPAQRGALAGREVGESARQRGRGGGAAGGRIGVERREDFRPRRRTRLNRHDHGGARRHLAVIVQRGTAGARVRIEIQAERDRVLGLRECRFERGVERRPFVAGKAVGRVAHAARLVDDEQHVHDRRPGDELGCAAGVGAAERDVRSAAQAWARAAEQDHARAA